MFGGPSCPSAQRPLLSSQGAAEICSLCSSCSDTSPFARARGCYAVRYWSLVGSCAGERGVAATKTRSAAHRNEPKTVWSQSAGSLLQMVL